MTDFSEDDSYKLWELTTNRSWENLYNLLYADYYEGHKVGLDNQLVYNLMETAQKFQDSETEFPEDSDQFYQTLTQQLAS